MHLSSGSWGVLVDRSYPQQGSRTYAVEQYSIEVPGVMICFSHVIQNWGRPAVSSSLASAFRYVTSITADFLELDADLLWAGVWVAVFLLESALEDLEVCRGARRCCLFIVTYSV